MMRERDQKGTQRNESSSIGTGLADADEELHKKKAQNRRDIWRLYGSCLLFLVSCVLFLAKEKQAHMQHLNLWYGLPNETWLLRISEHERHVFSQFGEDGVLEYIFDNIGTTNKFYVEFGVETGAECNTKLLREKYGWKGLLMDGGPANESINLRSHFIWPWNVMELFSLHHVPAEFDLLSIDVDSLDYWIWRNIDHARYRPRVVVTEFNRGLSPDDYLSVRNKIGWRWQYDNYMGASLRALHYLASHKGYALIHVESQGTNAFWLRKDLISKEIKEQLTFATVYKRFPPVHDPFSMEGDWVDVREYSLDPARDEVST